MDLSIIIVSFNVKRLLKKSLGSLAKSRGEIIVVDNGSRDGSVRMVMNNFPQIKLIKNNENLGFAKAVNQALRQVQGEYILLLNPDIEVRENTPGLLVKFAKEHPEAGVVAGRLLNPDGTIQGSCFHQLTLVNAVREFWLGERGAFEKYAPQTQEPVAVEAVVGACMLIPKKVIKQVGLFDEGYFMYFEDLDYCRRVRKAGLKVYYLPQAELVHHHGASGRGTPELTHQWLVESSKIYRGKIKYYLLTLIIRLGQKWRKTLKS